ncbi:hypothetical protein GF360_01840 [candidate division WWE3 bacterium]|nr:hypothetical protein [candidate division WWE3 bacterium]
MKIRVKIKPGAKESGVKEKTDMYGNVVYVVRVKSLPKNGEANEEMLELLGDYFEVPKTHLQIKSGFKSRNKIILVPKA